MTDVDTGSAQVQTGRTGLQPDANHPLPLWPQAHVHPEPAEVPASRAEQAAADSKERDDAVRQLAGALRAAERAHGAYVAELRVGDVEPAEDWSTWYAEYLLAPRDR